MNKEEVFTKVTNHLLKQQAKSIKKGDYGECYYRTPDPESNLSCAIGCLIKDDHYSINLEHKGVQDKEVLKALSLSLDTTISEEEKHFLMKLQEVHDNDHVEDWRVCLSLLAKDYSLNVQTPLFNKE